MFGFGFFQDGIPGRRPCAGNEARQCASPIRRRRSAYLLFHVEKRLLEQGRTYPKRCSSTQNYWKLKAITSGLPRLPMLWKAPMNPG